MLFVAALVSGSFFIFYPYPSVILLTIALAFTQNKTIIHAAFKGAIAGFVAGAAPILTVVFMTTTGRSDPTTGGAAMITIVTAPGGAILFAVVGLFVDFFKKLILPTGRDGQDV